MKYLRNTTFDVHMEDIDLSIPIVGQTVKVDVTYNVQEGL